MSLSTLLRSSVSICRARSTLGVTRLGTLSSLTVKPENHANSVTLTPIKPLGLTTALRGFATTSIKSSSHNHAKIWTIERALSLSLLGVMPLGIMYPNILFDLLMAVTTVMHVHWGVEAVAVDYIRPVIFGNIIPKIGILAVYGFSIFLLVGLLNLTFRGPGIGNSINSLWSNKK